MYGHTYATAHIASVGHKVKTKPIGLVVLALMIFGCGMMIGGMAILVSLVLAAPFIAMYAVMKDKHFVFFSTSGAEKQVFESENAEWITMITSAINLAIIERG